MRAKGVCGMNIHEFRKQFWETRNDRALNSNGIYVDTLHAELDQDGETLIHGEMWDGRNRIKAFPSNLSRKLYK